MDKNPLTSKTVWAGIVILGVGIATALGIELPLEVIYSICAALGLYGVRDAIDNKKKK
jgi:hypothetical protein|tara:strand:- start:298 stop:471 length:174 start_codon:yes stop_codon:yes gene_type:complete